MGWRAKAPRPAHSAALTSSRPQTPVHNSRNLESSRAETWNLPPQRKCTSVILPSAKRQGRHLAREGEQGGVARKGAPPGAQRGVGELQVSNPNP